jgi:hypothetical protein
MTKPAWTNPPGVIKGPGLDFSPQVLFTAALSRQLSKNVESKRNILSPLLVRRSVLAQMSFAADAPAAQVTLGGSDMSF